MCGYLRNMLSRVTYLLLRLVLTLTNLFLPHWDTVRRTRERIRRMLDLTTIESLSVWDNKLFTISLKGILSNVCIFSYFRCPINFFLGLILIKGIPACVNRNCVTHRSPGTWSSIHMTRPGLKLTAFINVSSGEKICQGTSGSRWYTLETSITTYLNQHV
jgi:hypothetical protein